MFGQIQPPLLVITPCFFLRIIHFKMEIWVCKEMLDFKFGDAKMFLLKNTFNKKIPKCSD